MDTQFCANLIRSLSKLANEGLSHIGLRIYSNLGTTKQKISVFDAYENLLSFLFTLTKYNGNNSEQFLDLILLILETETIKNIHKIHSFYLDIILSLFFY